MIVRFTGMVGGKNYGDKWNLSIEEAKVACISMPSCKGFYQDDREAQGGKKPTHFLSDITGIGEKEYCTGYSRVKCVNSWTVELDQDPSNLRKFKSLEDQREKDLISKQVTMPFNHKLDLLKVQKKICETWTPLPDKSLSRVIWDETQTPKQTVIDSAFWPSSDQPGLLKTGKILPGSFHPPEFKGPRLTVAEAKEYCFFHPECRGFSTQAIPSSTQEDPEGQRKILFNSEGTITPNFDNAILESKANEVMSEQVGWLARGDDLETPVYNEWNRIRNPYTLQEAKVKCFTDASCKGISVQKSKEWLLAHPNDRIGVFFKYAYIHNGNTKADWTSYRKADEAEAPIVGWTSWVLNAAAMPARPTPTQLLADPKIPKCLRARDNLFLHGERFCWSPCVKPTDSANACEALPLENDWVQLMSTDISVSSPDSVARADKAVMTCGSISSRWSGSSDRRLCQVMRVQHRCRTEEFTRPWEIRNSRSNALETVAARGIPAALLTGREHLQKKFEPFYGDLWLPDDFQLSWPAPAVMRGSIDWKVIVPSENSCIPLTLPWLFVGMGFDTHADHEINMHLGTMIFNCNGQSCNAIDQAHKHSTDLNTRELKAAVQYSGISKAGQGDGDDEWLFYNLKQMPAHATHIAVFVNIAEANGHFHQMKGAYLRLALSKERGAYDDFKTVSYFDLDNLQTEHQGMLFGVLFRESDSNWLWQKDLKAPAQLHEIPAQAKFTTEGHHWKFMSLQKTLHDTHLTSSNQRVIKEWMQKVALDTSTSERRWTPAEQIKKMTASQKDHLLVEADQDAFAGVAAEQFWSEHPAGPTTSAPKCFR